MGGIATNLAANSLSTSAPNDGSGQHVLRDRVSKVATGGLFDLSHRRHGSLAERQARESRRPHAIVAGENVPARAANAFGRVGSLRMVLRSNQGPTRESLWVQSRTAGLWAESTVSREFGKR